jgi:hypothetical protein
VCIRETATASPITRPGLDLTVTPLSALVEVGNLLINIGKTEIQEIEAEFVLNECKDEDEGLASLRGFIECTIRN